MLGPVSQTSTVLSRRNFLGLGAVGAVTSLLPTVRFSAALAEEEKRYVLIYEIDPQSVPAGTSAPDMDRVLKVVDRRLNAEAEKLARVRKLNDRQIEVTLIRHNDADRARVERQVTRSGTLEFRILANDHDNKAIIDRAKKEPSKSEVLDSAGRRVAWWVPVKAGQERGFTNSREIISRRRKQDGREVTDVLVVADPYNITGVYLTRVEIDVDNQGRPCIVFALTDAGGKLFARLTGEHLPNRATNFSYKLGIIIDGELWSAPQLNATISDRGMIEGHFSAEQVSDFANAMNAGSLSVRLRRVENRRTAE
jgi:SecD/SecF fusion protein